MKFEQMQYARPDFDAARETFASLRARISAAPDAQAQLEAFREFETLSRHISTMSTLAEIRHTVDTRDAFYEAEREFFDANSPALGEAQLDVYRALLASPFRTQLEQALGRLTFEKMEVDVKSSDPAILELMAEENALTTAYEKLYASALIEFDGRKNTVSQMKELIYQNYNHPCIVCWGVSNEITISTRDKADMLDNHRELNDLCHTMDSTRLTTLACYAMCGPFNPVAHITDLVSWNLYLGWYVPGLFLNDLWMDFFHLVYPGRPLGFSEYGAEGMPNLHSSKPRRGDHTEEYQAKYHEYMLRCFDRHKWMWATHVWNMFDFAADARDQGGEPGMNHKGLVTFDRKTRKDSFYLYKAWWSDENFVHICSKRFTDRTEREMEVKVYSNQKSVALYVNGEKAGEQIGEHVFSFRVPLTGEIEVRAVAGDCTDTASFRHVDTPNPSYKLVKTKSKSANWV